MRRRPAVSRAIVLACFAAGLAFGHTGGVSAAAFNVSPTRVDLSGRNASALLTLRNESAETIRFEITANAWDQAADGEMVLSPTDDILFFPALVSLSAGESKKVRVAATVAAGESEKSYRLFFEELPPLETTGSNQGPQVRILTKMGVPVFVAPAKRTVAASLTEPGIDRGRVAFEVMNDGTVRFSLFGVVLTGESDDGEELFRKEQSGWYVLAGGRRIYEAPLSADECRGLAVVRIEATTDQPADSGMAKLTSAARVSCAGE
jgi:fimbrial chaperone protein